MVIRGRSSRRSTRTSTFLFDLSVASSVSIESDDSCNVAFMDDVTLGGHLSSVADDVATISPKGSSMVCSLILTNAKL
jgi:hypothetical protein